MSSKVFEKHRVLTTCYSIPNANITSTLHQDTISAGTASLPKVVLNAPYAVPDVNLKTYIDPYEDDSQGQENARKTAKWVVFNDNKKLIESMPVLMHDENNPNDVDDEPHWATHAAESCRYMIMSRPPLKSLTDEEKKARKRRRKQIVKPRSDVTGY